MDEGLRLLLSLSLSGTVLAGLTALVLIPLRGRAPKAFAYYLWLLVLLRFLCPLGADRSLSHQAVAQSETIWVVTGGGAHGTESTNTYQGESLVSQETPMDRAVSTPAVLTALWAGGAVLVLGTRLWGCRRLRRELEEDAAPVQPWEQELYRNLAGRRAGIPKLLRTPGTQSPILAGLLCPRIYLPAEVMPGETLGHALRHELVHWRRKDLWYKHALTLATAIHWFNPAIWLLAGAVDRDCELSCDEAVVRSLSPEDRIRYGRTLLWAAERQISLNNNLSASLWNQKQYLKVRLHGIMKPNRISKMTVALLAAAALSLTAASAALGAYVGTERTAAAPQPPVLEPAKPVTDVLNDQKAGEVQLAWPFEDTEKIAISAMYGGRAHPVTGELTEHTGIDVVLEQKAAIFASAAGTVQEVHFTAENGNYVVLDHGNGMTTRYGCLEKNDFVQVGDAVEAGQQIGTVGKTGMATGYHLHFEVAVNDSRTDPLEYLPHSEVFVGKTDENTKMKY